MEVAATYHPSGMRQFLSLLAVIAAVTVPLLVAGLRSEPLRPPQAGAEVSARKLAAQVPEISRGVEKIRKLRYRKIPRPRVIGVPALTRLFAAQDRQGNAARGEQAGESALRLLGLIAPDESLSDADSQLAGQTAGAYDPKTKRLYIVRTPEAGDPALVQITLAHELDHALDDQNFGLPDSNDITDDRGIAQGALVEGTATEVMLLYAERFIDPAALLKAATDPQLLEDASSSGLPKSIEGDLNFEYFRGRKLVAALRKLSGRWNLVNIAFASRPPISTEQVMHPFKYLTYERPLPVAVHVGAVLPAPWRNLPGGVIGEFDTYQLLKLGSPQRVARRAAAGWGGQRTQLWRRGSAPCPGACRSRNALIAAWRWDTVADRRQFDRAADGYLVSGLGAHRRAPGLWSLKGSWVALDGGGSRSTIAFAPRARLAKRLSTSQAPARIAGR
jgi:hypothetical protein